MTLQTYVINYPKRHTMPNADETFKLLEANAKLLSDTLNTMRDERDIARASFEDIKLDRDFVLKKLNGTRDELDKVRESRDQQRKNFDEAQKGLNQMSGRIACLKDEIAELRATNADDNNVILDLRSKLFHQIDENKALRKAYADKNNENQTLINVGQAVAEQRDNLSAHVDAQHAQLDELRTEKVNLEITIGTLRKQLSDQRGHSDSLSLTNHNLTAENDKLRQQVLIPKKSYLDVNDVHNLVCGAMDKLELARTTLLKHI